MKHFFAFPNNPFVRFTRRGALLLALGAAGPAAWGQSFASKIDYSTCLVPDCLAVGDVNGDGWLDMVIGSGTTNMFSVLLGQASGGFGPKTDFTTSSLPLSLVLGDISGDGRLDMVMANFNGRGVSVLLGLSSGGFGPQSDYFTGKAVKDVALGDVNGDGRLDVIAANIAYTIYDPSDVSILMNLGGGNLAPAVNYPTWASVYSVTPGDVNGDGRLDLVTITGGAPVYKVSVLSGLASGGFGPATDYPAGLEPTRPALGDVNGDGRLDVVTANFQAQSVSVLLGSAGGGFSPKTDYPTATYPHDLALGDVNGDGLLDIVNSSTNSGTASVLLGLPGGIFGTKTDYAAGANPRRITLRDLNGDSRPDIITVNTNSNNVSVLLNTGTYTPLAARPTAPADVALAPNPAHDAFTVTLPAGTTATGAELLNALGQVVRRPAAAGSRFQVETAGLAPGLYSLRLQTGGTVLTKRVVVE